MSFCYNLCKEKKVFFFKNLETVDTCTKIKANIYKKVIFVFLHFNITLILFTMHFHLSAYMENSSEMAKVRHFDFSGC